MRHIAKYCNQWVKDILTKDKVFEVIGARNNLQAQTVMLQIKEKDCRKCHS